MIIEGLLDLIYGILEGLLGSSGIPSMPSDIISLLDIMEEYFLSAVSLIGIFVNWGVVVSLLYIVLSIIAFDWTYKILMWVLRKIPLASIE